MAELIDFFEFCEQNNIDFFYHTDKGYRRFTRRWYGDSFIKPSEKESFSIQLFQNKKVIKVGYKRKIPKIVFIEKKKAPLLHGNFFFFKGAVILVKEEKAHKYNTMYIGIVVDYV